MTASASSSTSASTRSRRGTSGCGTLLTWNPEKKRLYIHLLDYPMERLPIAFEKQVAYMQFLHDGSELQVKQLPEWQKYGNPDVRANGFVELPVLKPDVEIPVIEAFVK